MPKKRYKIELYGFARETREMTLKWKP